MAGDMILQSFCKKSERGLIVFEIAAAGKQGKLIIGKIRFQLPRFTLYGIEFIEKPT